MTKRSYDQPGCGLAAALDLLGERWTMLVVRELLVGPLRYTDLLSRLSGIGTNLLAARLRGLEDAGLVQRSALPPPAAGSVYELTEVGRGLEPALAQLANWGQRFVDDDNAPATIDARAAAFMMRAQFHAQRAGDLRETYQYEVGDHLLHASVDAGRVDPGPGPAPRPSPDAVVRTDPGTFIAMLRGRLTFDDALGGGRVEPQGDLDAARRAIELFQARPAPSDD